MRFLLSLLVWIIFIGGLKLYTVQRDAGLPKSPSETIAAEVMTGNYALLLTPTFSIEKDPFALQTDDFDQSGLVLSLNGNTLPLDADLLGRGKVARIDNLKTIQLGHNEIYIKASPPLGENMLDQGIRIQIEEDGRILASKTIWGEQGSIVSGTMHFNIKKKAMEDHGQY